MRAVLGLSVALLLLGGCSESSSTTPTPTVQRPKVANGTPGRTVVRKGRARDKNCVDSQKNAMHNQALLLILCAANALSLFG